MVFTARAFRIPKDGYTIEECEDACWFDERKRLFAVADGATDSAFQKSWAELLVTEFIQRPPDLSSHSTLISSFEAWIKPLQVKWNEHIDWDNLPFHGYNKARLTGGLATFLGIYFAPNEPKWYVFAIGDCNLFHFGKDNSLKMCYPIEHSSEFGSNPAALSSINQNYDIMSKYIKWTSGSYRIGDIFVLATDAYSEYVLKQYEAKPKIEHNLALSFKKIVKPNYKKTFSFQKKRKEKLIRNDDTTLLIILIEERCKKSDSI